MHAPSCPPENIAFRAAVGSYVASMVSLSNNTMCILAPELGMIIIIIAQLPMSLHDKMNKLIYKCSRSDHSHMHGITTTLESTKQSKRSREV